MLLQTIQRSWHSITPAQELVGVFLLLNLCAWFIVFVSKKWSSDKGSRSPTPDLEKPASRPGTKWKVTRKFGGECTIPRVYQLGFMSILLQNGRHPSSKDQPLLHIRTGMFTPPSQFPIDHSDTARELITCGISDECHADWDKKVFRDNGSEEYEMG